MAIALLEKNRLVIGATNLFVLAFVVAAAALFVAGYNIVAMICLCIPISVLMVSSPRLTAYFYVSCIFISWQLSPDPSFLLIDVASLLLMASFSVDFLLRNKTILGLPSIYKYYLGLLFALITATVFAYNFVYAITPLLRVAVQLLVVIILYNAADAGGAKKLIRLYFWVAVVHSIYNVVLFLRFGGADRIFGFAGAYFDDLAMLAWPIGLAHFIWSKSQVKSSAYGFGSILIFFGMIATQSRAPLFTLVWVGLALVIFSAYKANKTNAPFVLRRMKLLFWGITLVAVLFLAFSGVFTNVGERFQKLLETSHGTVWLRMSLWRTSLIAFLENPLTGTGPGSFRYVESIFPLLRFDAARLYLEGASAHNLFLHYLAETGLLGTAAILALFFKNLLTSIKLPRLSEKAVSTPISIGLLGVGLTIFVTVFYMDGWMWGQNAYVAPFFIALTARLANNRRYEEKTSHSR